MIQTITFSSFSSRKLVSAGRYRDPRRCGKGGGGGGGVCVCVWGGGGGTVHNFTTLPSKQHRLRKSVQLSCFGL